MAMDRELFRRRRLIFSEQPAVRPRRHLAVRRAFAQPLELTALPVVGLSGKSHAMLRPECRFAHASRYNRAATRYAIRTMQYTECKKLILNKFA